MRKLAANIFALGAADAGVRIIGFATTAYLGRTLGSEAFGLLGMGLALAGYLFLFASPGIHVTGTRDIAAGRGDPGEIVSTLMSIRMVLVPALLVLAVVAVLVWWDGGTPAATILASAAAIVPMALSFDWYFQGRSQFGLLSAQKLISASAFLMFAMWLVRAPEDVVIAALAFAAGTAVASLFSYLAFRREGRLAFSWDIPAWKSMLIGSYPIALSSVLGLTSTSFPILVAGAMLSSQDAGHMNAAVKLVVLALIVDRVFATLFLPGLSRAANTEDQARIVRLGLKLMLLVALPVGVAGWVLAPDLILLVFGENFETAVSPFRILLVYLAMTLLNSVFVPALVVAHRERMYFKIVLVGSCVTAGLAIAATPLIGIVGTAAAVSAGEAVMVALFLYALRSHDILADARELAHVLGAASAMAIAAGALARVSPFAAVAVGLVMYAGVLAALKAVSRDDLALLREVGG